MPEPVGLPRGEVHVWRGGLEPAADVLARLEATLADDERARAARFVFPRHRVQYVACRGILRELLGRYLDTEPRAVRFRYTAHGKPELDGVVSDLRFNVSNCETVGLFAFASGRVVGVDVERLRPMDDALAIAERFFSAPENAVFRATPAEGRDAAFFRCWTRKEAYIKAVGEGLSMPLDRFDVTLAQGEPARLVATRPDATQAERWTLRELALGPEWIGAVIAEGRDWELVSREWESAETPRPLQAAG